MPRTTAVRFRSSSSFWPVGESLFSNTVFRCRPLIQLKIIQEVISLLVFTVFTVLVFRTETFRWNHVAAFVCIVLAVYFVFRK